MLFALMMGGLVLLAGHVLLSSVAFAPVLQLSSTTTLIAEPHPLLKVPVAVGVLSSGKSQERRMLWRSTLLPIVRQLTELQHGADYVLKFIVGQCHPVAFRSAALHAALITFVHFRTHIKLTLFFGPLSLVRRPRTERGG